MTVMMVVKCLLLVALLSSVHGWHSSAAMKVARVQRRSLFSSPPGHTSDDATSFAGSTLTSLQRLSTVTAAVGAGVLVASQSSSAKDKLLWNQVPLPVKETLFDISFDPSKPDHGWLVGAKGTFLETFDGGLNWITRSFTSLDEDEEINYRFEVASLLDNEGWIIGKPSIMLHTRDGGKQFERIPLSPKLPGDPCSIKATGAGKAEMITTQGAVYTTVNGGLNWKAQVKETIDATLNRVSSSGTSGASFFTGKIANQIRDEAGNYIAIGSRGNLFLTWSPGQEYWIPHNRGSSRRIQNMGFVGNDASKGLWMTLNGGALLKTTSNPDLTQVDIETLFQSSKINTGGYGIIDVCWRDDNNVWAVGGSGVIFQSTDGGQTFKFNGDAKDIPGNLYRIKFFGTESGFVLGSNGVLLKYAA